MRSGLSRLALFLLTALLMATPAVTAQKLPPIEPPEPMPSAHSDATTLRVTANEVLVPTLVEKRGGGIVYGLKPEDFVLEDNGVPQKIRVQEEMDTAPVALVVAVEQGGVSVLEFDKLAKLGPLLDLFLSDGKEPGGAGGLRLQAASDSRLTRTPARRSTRRSSTWSRATAATRFSIRSATPSICWKSQPKEYRRVLLLISEERDHGSKHTKPAQLIQKIGRSDVLVLSVSFSPARAELAHDIKDIGGTDQRR